MRTLSPAGLALYNRILRGERIPWVQLVRLDLSVTQYLTTAGRSLEWDGHLWRTASIGAIEEIKDAAGELQSLAFSLPAAREVYLSLALTEEVEGDAVRVWDALVDPANGQVADAVLAYRGTLNMVTVTDGPVAMARVTSEHRGIQALRPKPRRYNDATQRRLHPGDSCCDIDPATDAAPVVWPAASFFRR